MAKTRQELTKEIELSLGGGMVDVELDPEHYDLAIDKALSKYRQRSSRSTEESFIALTLKLEVQDYVLPSEVIEVKDIYRRVTGSFGSGVGADIEPFEAAYLNTYMLHLCIYWVNGCPNFSEYAECFIRNCEILLSIPSKGVRATFPKQNQLLIAQRI